MIDINLVNLFKIHENYGHDPHSFICSCYHINTWGDYEMLIEEINKLKLHTLQDVVDSKIESGDLAGIFFLISKIDNPKQALDNLFKKNPTLLMSPQFLKAMPEIYEEYAQQRKELKKSLLDRYIKGEL